MGSAVENAPQAVQWPQGVLLTCNKRLKRVVEAIVELASGRGFVEGARESGSEQGGEGGVSVARGVPTGTGLHNSFQNAYQGYRALRS